MDIHSAPSGAAIAANARKSVKDYVLAGWASMAGTTIEWYDFFLYGTAAALVFNKIFFPALDPILGTLAAGGGQPHYVVVYMVALGVVALVCTCFMRQSKS